MNEAIIFCAKYLIVFVVLGLAVAWFHVGREHKLRFVVAVVIGGIAALVLSRIGSHFFYDPRPFVSQHVTPLIPHAPDNGFPSDHSLFAGMLTGATYFFSKKVAAVMAVLTILIGVARVLAHVHSPIDILGGWVFGVIGAVAGYYATLWIFDRYTAKRQKA